MELFNYLPKRKAAKCLRIQRLINPKESRVEINRGTSPPTDPHSTICPRSHRTTLPRNPTSSAPNPHCAPYHCKDTVRRVLCADALHLHAEGVVVHVFDVHYGGAVGPPVHPRIAQVPVPTPRGSFNVYSYRKVSEINTQRPSACLSRDLGGKWLPDSPRRTRCRRRSFSSRRRLPWSVFRRRRCR